MSIIQNLLGENVVNNESKTLNTDDFSQKCQVIGLYFSAHWCPPCRAFTPELSKFYEKFKKTDRGSELEIVFLSSDKDQKSFDDYFKEMPWYCVPWSDRQRKQMLSKKFNVQGIPMLILIDSKTGEVICAKGRENVNEDPDGSRFPWKPPSLATLLNGPLCKTASTELNEFTSVFNGKKIGLYFSAHWCPPCRGFTPKLVSTYAAIKGADKPLEVIFISADRSENSFNEYLSTMPWFAIPYADSGRRQQISKHFKIEGIPAFVILDENLEIITRNGRSQVMDDPEGKEFPWYPKALNALDDSSAHLINETACLIYFTDCDDEEIAKAQELMQDVAEQYVEEEKARKSANKEAKPLAFFYEGRKSEELVESLRNFACLSDRDNLLAIINLPEESIYELPESEPITKESFRKLVEDFKNNEIKYRKLRPNTST